MNNEIENRAHPRVPIEIAVDLESEHNFYSGITADISEGGLFVATYVPPDLGTRLDLQLRLPGEKESFPVRGVVRWVRELNAACDGAPPGFGLAWLVLTAEGLAAIQRFVARRDTILFDAA